MNEDVRNEVLRRWYGGQSMRGIARDLHLSRKTVAGIVADHQQQRVQGVTGLPLHQAAVDLCQRIQLPLPRLATSFSPTPRQSCCVASLTPLRNH